MDFSNLIVKRVISAHKLSNDAGAASHREDRRYTAIFLRFEGETEYRFGHEHIRSNLSHPVLLPKGSSYHWRCLESGRCLYVEFDTDLTAPAPIGFSVPEPERPRMLLQKLEQLSLHRPPYWQALARAMIYELLFLLFSSDTSQASAYLPSERLQRLRPALDYMHAHYNEPLSNDLLASLSNVSTVYFRKLFTAATGSAPIRYLHHLRIEKAKELLQSDYATLSDVAIAVGYSNVFHFSKMFKGITGLSPGAYATQIGNRA